MKIYLDLLYHCHAENDGTMREFDIDFFDNKCKAFIEGYRYVPSGEQWRRSDGQVFSGEMIAPWKNYDILSVVQQTADEVQAKADAELAELIEEVYLSDLELMSEDIEE